MSQPSISIGSNRWQLESKTEKVTLVSSGRAILASKCALSKYQKVQYHSSEINTDIYKKIC